MKKSAKKGSAKKAPKKKPSRPAAKAKSRKPARTTAASRPAAAKTDAGTYTPQPIEGMGWAPFRYPL